MENYEQENSDVVAEVNQPSTNKSLVIILGAIVFILLLLASFYIGTKYNSALNNLLNQDSSEETQKSEDGYSDITAKKFDAQIADDVLKTNRLLDAFTVLNISDGVINSESITISWKVSDEVFDVFPKEETYVMFDLYNSKTGSRVTSIGDGFLFPKNTYTENISDLVRDNRVNSEDNYFVKATLQVQPSDFQCDPSVKGECVPVYNRDDAQLIERAKQLSYEGSSFTFNDTLWQNVNKQSSVSITGPSEVVLGEKNTWVGKIVNDDSNSVDVNCRVSRWQTGPDRFGNDFTYSDWGEKIFDGVSQNGGSFTLEWSATETTEGDKYFEISCTPWEENGSFAGNSGSIQFEVVQ